MSKKAPIVREFMTHLPEEIQGAEDLKSAMEIMREKGIRHLPVFEGIKVKGILSDRDVKFALAAMGEQAHDLKIRDICSDDVYECSPMTPINEVAGHMAEHKMGSAVVKDGGFLVGIFTVTDALKALAKAY